MEIQRAKFRMGIGEWIGVFGILLALVTWWHSTKTRDLSVRVSPSVVEVVKGGVASDLSVSYLGKAVTSDLRAYQIAIWNAGREPIRREDVLKPLTLSWSANSKVIEIKVVKSTRAETEISLVSTDYDSRVARFDWKILENSDGGLVQLLIQGSERPAFSISGTVVGQERISYELKGPSAAKQDSSRTVTKWSMRFLFPILCLAFALFVFNEANSLYRTVTIKPLRRRALLLEAFKLLTSLLILCFCVYMSWLVFLPESPFDF